MEAGAAATQVDLFSAYTVFWLLIALFVRRIARKQRELSAKLRELETSESGGKE